MNERHDLGVSRRELLKGASCGFGYLAFAGLSTMAAEAEKGPLSPKSPHFKAKAKRVILLCMRGGPSHVDTFDYKPQLAKDTGKPGRSRGGRAAELLGSPWEFSQHGESGLWISELFPEVAKHADDLCILNGMHTDLPNHPQAFVQMHTGNFQFVRPSLGAWTLYGLGTENDNLPGFITLNAPTGVGGAQNYGSAFLPAVYQGTKIGTGQPRPGGGQQRFRRGGGPAPDPIENIKNDELSKNLQRVQLDLIKSLNMEKLKRDQHHPEVEGVIESFELAFRMQASMPELTDLSTEPESTFNLYGPDSKKPNTFARNCVIARRLAERGVRFIQLYHRAWDQHGNLPR
ncbi:MAG: DUF1501 domain-containing protein, partial [Verrucomicrobiota bacterium]